MLELLAVPVAMATAALWPSKKDEVKKINAIFAAAEFGMKKKGELTIPDFRSKRAILNGKKVVGMEYWFALPLGMSETKIKKIAEENILGVGLQKTVRVTFDDLLKVKVYDTKIPKLLPYKELPQTNRWTIPIGSGFDDYVYHNFDHTPHMVISGTTRFGKTVFLKHAMTRLIENNPDDIEFYIIDLKGGLEFGPYERLKQVKRVVANPEDAALLLDRMLNQIEGEYHKFRTNNWSNVVDTPIKKRKFIIVDEAAQLAPEKWMDKETKALLSFCQAKLCEIARIAGALGYRLLYCTQYPTADTVPRQIKQNADAKLSFRLSTSIASKVAIDVTGAEELPSDIKGRALYKTHEVKEIQAPLIDNKEMMERLQSYIVPSVAVVPPSEVIEQPKEEDKHVNHLSEKERTPRKNLIEFR
ncbi:FtsK/SpoIIIE domain-containing protein [Bacillus badius]|uniref:Cell division protein FtsK n=1 Tax=Bacillus badius TaxID=1455 RepID=A0ABR5AXZ2_BACBA|nr:FtsK/SpoIIIE domain-containing protein [Bacillus badius]KIL79613.1 Cell division protein FtsK [Bacillus badius]MED4716309.1 FtsK/SpoIIIE domain-containing protein [Bacillus badius]